jgi:hypothetical protein
MIGENTKSKVPPYRVTMLFEYKEINFQANIDCKIKQRKSHNPKY